MILSRHEKIGKKNLAEDSRDKTTSMYKTTICKTKDRKVSTEEPHTKKLRDILLQHKTEKLAEKQIKKF